MSSLRLCDQLPTSQRYYPKNQAISYFQKPKGEFTLVVEGNKAEDQIQVTEEIEQKLQSLRLSGKSAKEAIARVAAETGLSRRELYRTWLKKKRAH